VFILPGRRRHHLFLCQLVRGGRFELRFEVFGLQWVLSACNQPHPPVGGGVTRFWSSSFGMWFPAPPRPMRTYVDIISLRCGGLVRSSVFEGVKSELLYCRYDVVG